MYRGIWITLPALGGGGWNEQDDKLPSANSPHLGIRTGWRLNAK
jgi:hypothetical protein